MDTDFCDADITHAIWKGIKILNCDFEGAYLTWSDLSYSNIEIVNFSNTDLTGTVFAETSMYNVTFDNSTLNNARIDEIIKEEKLADETKDNEKKRELYERAESTYREFKNYFHREGVYDRSSWYHYREKLMNRKKRTFRDPMKYISFTVDKLYGYGEKPFYLIGWWILLIIAFATLYAWNGQSFGQFFEMLHYSYQTFFGLPVLESQSITTNTATLTILAIAESIMGKIFITLFITIISRKTMHL